MLEAIRENFSLSWEWPKTPEVPPDPLCLGVLEVEKVVGLNGIDPSDPLWQVVHLTKAKSLTQKLIEWIDQPSEQLQQLADWSPGRPYPEKVQPLLEWVQVALSNLAARGRSAALQMPRWGHLQFLMDSLWDSALNAYEELRYGDAPATLWIIEGGIGDPSDCEK